MSASRYERGNLEQNDYADLYLLEIASGKIERLTKNTDIAEGSVSFSPDSKMVAFSAPDDFKFMHLEKIYVRPIANPAAPWKKLGGTFDYDVRIGRGGGDGVENGFWSANGDTIYFNTGFHATTQLFARLGGERRREAAHRSQGRDARSVATPRRASSSSPTAIRRRRRRRTPSARCATSATSRSGRSSPIRIRG